MLSFAKSFSYKTTLVISTGLIMMLFYNYLYAYVNNEWKQNIYKSLQTHREAIRYLQDIDTTYNIRHIRIVLSSILCARKTRSRNSARWLLRTARSERG